MPNPPLVSAIIPAYNAADTLGRAANSVLRQTYPSIELIVVNDGSTDKTRAVAESFPEVCCLSQPNEGPGSARNLGASHAQARYLAFLDADDEWTPTKIERQMAVFAGDDRMAGLGTHRIRGVVDCEGNVLSRRSSPRADGRLVEVTFGQLIRGNRICGASVLVRRAAFDDMGGFDVALLAAQDYDLWLRMVAAGHRLFNLNEPLYVFYERPGSLRSDLRKVVSCHQAILTKWDPSANRASPLSAEEFAVVKQWWLLKDAFRVFCQDECSWGRALVNEASRLESPHHVQNGLVRLARMSPRLFRTLGRLRGYPRYTG